MNNIDILKFQTCPRRINENGPWEKTENIDMWDKDNKCTFCGSLHPKKFLESIKKGVKLTPTDKTYKCYLLSDKFYFQHFNDEQQSEFINLLNEEKLSMGFPGFFYVTPFFCEKVKNGE